LAQAFLVQASVKHIQMAKGTMHVALAAMMCGLGGVLLSGCGSKEAESPTNPKPTLEQVWQRQRSALESGNVTDLLADFSPSVYYSYWVEDENGTVNGFGGGPGHENVDEAYVEIVRTVDGPLKVVATVDETQPPIIFSIWSGSGIDFASSVSVFDEQSRIIFHDVYVLETPVAVEQEVTSVERAGGLEPHYSMEQRWLNRDIDGLMDLYRDDSKLLYFDEEEVFHVSRGVTEIREFFENTNLTVPFIQPKSVVAKSSRAGDACKSWLSGFHGDGMRRLSMLMYVSHGDDLRNCSSASDSSWIQFQVMGYFPGYDAEAPPLLL